MRIPDPKANTTTEAYLAYKAGYLEESELKPVLYEPYLHFDAWLAYWAGLTTDYPLDKNGDPEMLTDEEALVAYLSGVTDTYPEEIKDPYDVRIVGYLKYLASVRWGRPEYPVNNEEFYLSTMDAPVVPSGDTPSSDIEMDDTADMPFVDIKLYGDANQRTTTGKNLFEIPDITRTETDITWTVSEGYHAVGSGTASSNAGSYLVGNYLPITYDTDGDFTFSISEPINAAIYYRFYSDDNTNLGQLSISAGNRYVTGTIPNGATRYRVLLAPSTGVSYDIDIYLQLEKGSSATPIEKPTGGIPMPNLEYPSDINIVTGRQVISTKGKNLFDASFSPELSGETGGDFVLERSGNRYLRFFFPEPLPAGEYSFSFDMPENTTMNGVSFTLFGSGDVDLGRILYIRDTRYEVNLTVNAPIVMIRFFIASDEAETAYSVIKNMQIEAGGEVTAFAPYKAPANYEINLGKNLFDGVLESGIINGNTGENAPNANYVRAKNYIPVKELTNYAISSTNGDIASFNIYEYRADFTYNLTANRVVQKGRFWQTRAGTKYIRFRPAYQSTDTTMKFQVEMGDTITEYAPYFEPIELCGLSGYKDNIYRDSNGDWYLHKEFGKQIITSDTDIFLASTYANIEYARIAKPLDAYFYDNYKPLQNSVIATYGTLLYNTNPEGFDYSGWVGRIVLQAELTKYYLGVVKGTGLDAIKAKLQSGIAYYKLAENTDTKITNETLISQLNAVIDGGSYQGTTYIKTTASGSNLPAGLIVEAYKY